jgi:hypothetical protein
MSTPTIVPMFDDQGTLRDVPYERVVEARQNGMSPAVRMKFADDGDKVRYVPASRMTEAAHNGGQVLPIEEQAVQHPGFWHTLGEDIHGLAKGLPSMFSGFAGPIADPTTGQFTHPGAAQGLQTGAAALEADQQRKAQGSGFPYRAGALLATATGTNVKGMEQAAEQGDMGGVLGHAAAVPVALAATEGVMRRGNAAGGALNKMRPSVMKQAAGELFNVVSKDAGKVPVKLSPATQEAADALLNRQRATNLGPEVNKFLNRVTNPKLGDLTYDEARMFQQELNGKLYGSTGKPLSGAAEAEVKSALANLKTDVGNAAGEVNRAAEYYKAMGDYASAARMEEWIKRAKKATPWVVGALGVAGVGKAIHLGDLLAGGQ